MRLELRPLLAAALTVTAVVPALAREIGDVQAVTKSAYGTPPDAAKEAKHQGDAVADHEWLETLAQSGMLVRFADGSRLTLGADSKVLLDAFVYDPAHSDSDEAAKAAIALPAGLLRYVTGAMPKGRTVIETPTATLTLRGTDVRVGVNDRGETHLTVDEGKVTVRSKLTGEQIEVDAGGSIDVTPQQISKSERGETGDPSVDHGLKEKDGHLGNDIRRGGQIDGGSKERSSGRGSSRGEGRGHSGGGDSGGGDSGGGDSGGGDSGGGDSGGGDSGGDSGGDTGGSTGG